MLYVYFENSKAVRATDQHPVDFNRTDYQTRNDWKTFERAQEVTDQLNTGWLTARPRYLAIDRGPFYSPRYDVIAAPRVGERISYAFNGDYYPDGEIVKISDSYRVVTSSTGSRYYRRNQTGAWIKAGGTWSMVKGHHNDKNPHF